MLKNSIALFCARAFNAVFVFALTLAASRWLGPAQFGIYAFITTVVLTGSYFANFGLDTLLVREIARDPAQAHHLVKRMLALKLLTGFATLGGIALVFLLLPLDYATRVPLFILSASLVMNTLSQTLWHVGDGFENFANHSILWSASNFLKAAIGIAALWQWQTLTAFACALVLAETLALGLALALTHRRFHCVGFDFDRGEHRQLLRNALPIALSVILSAIYFRLDVLMLKALDGNPAVGYYSAAWRVMEAFTLIPGILIMVLFPTLSKDFKARSGQFESRIFRNFWFLLLCAVGACLFLYFGSGFLIPLLFGDAYLESTATLRILGLSLIFYFINFLLAHALISSGREKINTQRLAICTLVNILLNFALIPTYSHPGAAWATVISEAVLSLLLAVEVRKLLRQLRMESSSAIE